MSKKHLSLWVVLCVLMVVCFALSACTQQGKPTPEELAQIEAARIADEQAQEAARAAAEQAAKHTAEVARAEGADIRVMSYNIRMDAGLGALGSVDAWSLRREPMVEQILEYAPDVIGMQEVKYNQLTYLAEHLPEYSYVFQDRDSAENRGESNAVFYRTELFEVADSGTFWLSESREEYSRYSGAACNRICTYIVLQLRGTQATFCFANTHLDHVSEEARRFGASVITDWIDGVEFPVIVTGDMNTGRNSSAYTTYTAVLEDAAKATTDTEVSGTYHAYSEISADASPIDYIFVASSIEVLKYRVLNEKVDDVYTSDHYAIFADIVLPRNE